jgi:alkylated DNA repair dioxygenase AlkB
MDDLFTTESTLEQILLEDADLYYLRDLPLAQNAEAVMNQLIDEVPSRAEKIVVWGKPYRQPRLTAWYGDDEAIYTYSGIRLDPLPWTHTLIETKNASKQLLG